MRIGYIGVGGEGRVLLGAADRPTPTSSRMADINPAQLAQADAVLEERRPRQGGALRRVARDDRRRKTLEGVVIADAALVARGDRHRPASRPGMHVLCEKMMAWDVEGCERMRATARRTGKRARDRLSAQLQPDLPGGLRGHHQGRRPRRRVTWRASPGTATATGAAAGEPPAPDYDPSKWGYPTWEHLLNWRLYKSTRAACSPSSPATR